MYTTMDRVFQDKHVADLKRRKNQFDIQIIAIAVNEMANLFLSDKRKTVSVGQLANENKRGYLFLKTPCKSKIILLILTLSRFASFVVTISIFLLIINSTSNALFINCRNMSLKFLSFSLNYLLACYYQGPSKTIYLLLVLRMECGTVNRAPQEVCEELSN